MLKKKTLAFLTVAFVMVLALAVQSQAADKPKDYPSRPIEVVVQYGAGGGSDNFVRNLMMRGRRELGTAVNITNMTGGAGVKASQYVLSQPADGYTIYNFSPATTSVRNSSSTQSWAAKITARSLCRFARCSRTKVCSL